MPRSNANPGFGIKFYVGNTDSPVVFTELAEVQEITGIGAQHITDEVTHMSSPNGWAEFIGTGVKEQKPFTLPMNFVADYAAQKQLLNERLESGGRHYYKIKFTDAAETELVFEAIIADVDINHAQRAAADCNVQFRPSGQYAWYTNS
jgi:hypothetical protein